MLVFTYKQKDGVIKRQYFFRIGDVVRVRYYGAAYSDWNRGNLYFTGDARNPFYNQYHNERKDGMLFKVKKMAFHSYVHDGIVCYIEDRERKGIIINAKALEVVRQFPLRKDENQLVKLEKIK
jgi:hypothetical protein